MYEKVCNIIQNVKICIRVEQERNQDLNLGGPKHEPKKFHVTWFIKKKIMVDKKLHFIT